MSKKRQREQKTINEKYEKHVANGEKHAKSKVVAQFKLAQLSSLNRILEKKNEIIESYKSSLVVREYDLQVVSIVRLMLSCTCILL